MNALSSDYRDVLSGAHAPPCLSLYQPTHRRQPDRRQDSIRFRNLVKTLEQSLRRGYPARDAEPLLAPFHALADDGASWNHGQDGLEADRMIGGHIDGATGAIRLDDLDNADVDDLLDDLGEQVLKNGGDVVVLPSERMPSSTGVAATYRYR